MLDYLALELGSTQSAGSYPVFQSAGVTVDLGVDPGLLVAFADETMSIGLAVDQFLV